MFVDELLDTDMKNFSEWLADHLKSENMGSVVAADMYGPGSEEWERDEEQLRHEDEVRARAKAIKAIRKKREAAVRTSKGSPNKGLFGWGHFGL
jgi:hypothetical protein